jgi:hypothetical protein
MPCRRILTVFVSAVALVAGVGATALAAGVHDLRAAEEAFYKAGLPFEVEWTPNPYLRPTLGPTSDSSLVRVPKPLLAHVTGWAEGVNAVKFQEWSVTVFNQSTSALAFARLAAHGTPFLVLRADNVVYVGTRLPAAKRAVAQLRRNQ